jgi:hypothetical protein
MLDLWPAFFTLEFHERRNANLEYGSFGADTLKRKLVLPSLNVFFAAHRPWSQNRQSHCLWNIRNLTEFARQHIL